MLRGRPAAASLIPLGRNSEKPLVEKIRFHLEEQIIAGRLKPRQRLVEEEIARELSVSRSPIREALRALEREGLVTLTPGRGACVADLTPEEVDDVYAVRVRLGGLLFSLAAHHVTEAAVDRLDQVVAEMEQVVADADIQRYFLLDLDFEERVMEACPNKKLVAVWRNLGRPILRFRYFSLYPPGRLPTSLQYHRDLVVAFRHRDGATADRLVQQNIEAAGQALRDHLRSSMA
jgi:DNA-binding GntR family transcriptional regulator